MKSSSPDTVDPLRQCMALLRQKRYGAFSRLLNQTLAVQGLSADLCQMAAEYCQVTNNQHGMVEWLTRWAGVAPSDPQPLMHLANVYQQQGATKNALEALDLAQKAGADAMRIAISRAKILIGAGRYTEVADAAAPSCPDALDLARLMQGLTLLARNLAVAAAREDLRDLVRSVAGRSMGLAADAEGLLLVLGTTGKRLRPYDRKSSLVRELTAQIKAKSCGCVIGSAELLDLVVPAARVHDGSFWGSRSRVYVVESDEGMLTLALATVDVRDALTDEAVTWVWGPTALGQLERYLTEREDEPPQNITVSSSPQVARVVDKASQVFHQKVEAWFREASIYYANLPREHWGDVLGDSPSRPPRVLLITTEFSSFMKFSIRDLAAAFERRGWQMQVAKESQPTHRMTGVTVPKTVATFRPDLIWQINFMRNAWKGGVPDGVPFISWNQDNMPHMLSREQAAQVGRFDFLAHLGSGVGYIRRYGYPSSQLIHLPMCVDRGIFCPEPDDRPDTDVCFVSHHGWTADQRIDQLLENSDPGDAPLLRRLLDEYVAQLGDYFVRTGEPIGREDSDDMLGEIARSLKVPLNGPLADALADYLHRVVANAMWRHQAVRWVADCGVRLTLYGQGWDKAQEFVRYAAGVVEHGRALRDVLASSRVALQAVLASNEHQRLWESAACGTVVLMRYHPGDEAFTVIRQWMDRFEKGVGQPIEEIIRLDERSSSAERFSLRAIRFLAEDGILSEEVLVCVRRIAQTLSVRDKIGASFADVCFRNADDLRDKLRRILTDEPYRRQLREELLEAVRYHDYQVQIPRVIRELRQRLASA